MFMYQGDDLSPKGFTAQCDGGPDDGNLITSFSQEWVCVVTYFRALDGGKSPHAQVVKGKYVFRQDDQGPVWKWQFDKED